MSSEKQTAKRVEREFFMSDALTVAKELIGKILVRKIEGNELRFRITETEAYCGQEDTACHAHKGKTPRNAVMYRQGGCAYIYLCYGIHYLLNIVVAQQDNPEAVLIRGAQCLDCSDNAELCAKTNPENLKYLKPFKSLDGPGKLTKAARIDGSLNGTDIITGDALWLEDDGVVGTFIQTKRVGIDYATEEYKNKPWRFISK